MNVNRRVMALAGIVIVVVATVGIVVVLDPWGTELHFRQEYTGGEDTKVLLTIWSLRDCNLTVSFVNDTSLLFDIQASLYEPSDTLSVTHESSDYWLIEGRGRQKRIDILLGTGVCYDINIGEGTNLNTTITVGNGAIIDGQSIKALHTGVVRFSFREQNEPDIRSGFGVTLGFQPYTPTALVDIDLPNNMDGELRAGDSPISFVAISGWYSRGFGKYSTATHEGNHLMEMVCNCESVLARLID